MTLAVQEQKQPYIPIMERAHLGTVKRFKSEAEIKASYSNARKMCFSPPKKEKPAEAIEVKPIIEAAKDVVTETPEEESDRLARSHQKMEEILSKFGTKSICSSRPSGMSIIDRFAKAHKVSVGEIVGPRRSRYLIAPRFEAIVAVAIERPDMSLPQIGRLFNRDHTSIINAFKKMGFHRPTNTYYQTR